MIRHPKRLLVFLLLALAGCASQRTTTGGPVEDDRPSPLAEYRSIRQLTDADTSAVYVPWIALLPFKDESGFREGVFDLPRDMPRMLARELSARGICRVIPAAAVEEALAGRNARWIEANRAALGEMLLADHLLTGVLLDYNFERLTVGDPLLGGYKSYVGTAEFEADLWGGETFGPMGVAHARAESQTRGLGLDLLGKPRQGDLHFSNLSSIQHGSEEFRSTAIGEATVAAIDEVAQEIGHLLQPRQLVGLEGDPKVLSVSGPEIFIGAGRENGVRKGYRFYVIGSASDEERPLVEVADVISASVSRVTALRGARWIAAGQTLQLVVVDVESEPVESGPEPE